ncbi:MAG: NAD(P)/FAD-dependent oxidoreductase [Parvularculaceae bacterium]
MFDDPAGANDYELAIVGGGIAGNMLAAAMARHGVKTLVLEAGSHPKFAIGESMILETSEIMRSLARVFDVPELEYFSAEHFLPAIGGSHGVKRHFSYLPHREGEPARGEDAIQAVIPAQPYGHELHIYRQDSDYFYAGVAVRYGAEVRQNARVATVDIDGAGARIDLADGASLTADYVVDAGGPGAIMATSRGLRRSDMTTNTRALFTHMTGVKSIHTDGPSAAEYGAPFSLAEGTLHHVFEGGWMWIIPFNNHRDATNEFCSVGLVLDPRVHGPTPNVSPADEFAAFIARYPDIARHLDGARPVRDWVRADRLQYVARAVAGDRFCLLGHAAGFIDPLFSKGLYTSLSCVLSFGRAFLAARAAGDYSRARFADHEAQTQRFVASNDRLVANAIKSFSHAELWRVYSVVWILGAYLELVRLTTFRQSLLKRRRTAEERLAVAPPELRLVGGGYAPFDALADEIDQTIEALDVKDEAAVSDAVAKIRARILGERWIPESHRAIARGARALPRNKFTWRLLFNKGGVLGPPDYRRHFFGDTSLVELAAFFAAERVRYSRTAIARRHRQRLRAAI